jgi:hypothetical protein
MQKARKTDDIPREAQVCGAKAAGEFFKQIEGEGLSVGELSSLCNQVCVSHPSEESAC